ncbi:uncharacterized protein LOC131616833 [Vicia villosa]|uniref:uncharacterized protein LOC131616833 n=1 Tax=Vicia villosa TaxID=3911 RepID=UPI00273BCECD|nr:uncharacterized protein LOC131616833 [Vicia villosa]XP_058744263.1 uncharacterized protein LOC131616833 [Vicia villosa]XP_058744264.1 uncharacterized protein LOC131616833 [Vicia villosa]XP_058744265.1 uncharacterized protein LOC131616833 [Vicia villosa]XP_058744266.1 uncharacterized protein LOC131616833 [Vicia villosa]XP_058744267.1 uncharacterized protein LOC131616833 [Vicia villosa]XP_058744268.1 uncharacterized protein LOC131616833 [Vicia villosa]
MLSSSSTQHKMSSAHLVQHKYGYHPLKTCSIPHDELEVLCETMVDFEKLLEHDFKTKAAMLVQGWSNYFERLVGPVYPLLVMDFWTHAIVTPTAIISFVLGHEVVVTEKIIRKLYGLDDSDGITGALPGRVEWEKVDRELSSSRSASHQTTSLKPSYRIWAEIILGSLYHRKRSLTATYVNQDQKYVLFCIGKGIQVNLSNILFQHLKTNIEESRDEERKKNPSPLTHSLPSRKSKPYCLLYPDYRFTFNPPEPSLDVCFDLFKLKLRTRMETLRAAHDSQLDHVAIRGLWKIFKKDFQFDAMNIQKKCMAEASGSSGYCLELDDGKYYHPIRNSRSLEEEKFVDEMKDEPCLAMIVWKPQFTVLTGDFQSLFNWLRENPLEKAPDMVYPAVEYPSEVAAPTPPKNLAEILQALENEDSDIPTPDYAEDASMSEADAEKQSAENHPAEKLPVQENQDDVLMIDAAVEHAIPLDDSCEASSDEPSVLVNAMKALQKNQADLASHLDKHEDTHNEFRSFMKTQSASTSEIQHLLAKIVSKLG